MKVGEDAESLHRVKDGHDDIIKLQDEDSCEATRSNRIMAANRVSKKWK